MPGLVGRFGAREGRVKVGVSRLVDDGSVQLLDAPVAPSVVESKPSLVNLG